MHFQDSLKGAVKNFMMICLFLYLTDFLLSEDDELTEALWRAVNNTSSVLYIAPMTGSTRLEGPIDVECKQFLNVSD